MQAFDTRNPSQCDRINYDSTVLQSVSCINMQLEPLKLQNDSMSRIVPPTMESKKANTGNEKKEHK